MIHLDANNQKDRTVQGMSDQLQQFDQMYQRANVAYGSEPSPVLNSLLRDMKFSRSENVELRGIDLGCGAGRDALAMARAGIRVKAFDACSTGIERLQAEARIHGLGDYVSTLQFDVRDIVLEPDSFDVVVATTVLDHLPFSDSETLWRKLCLAVRPNGFLYVEVHLDEDPGASRTSLDRATLNQVLPSSESADKVINYFHSGQLLRWLYELPSNLRVLHYEEPWEWDITHGSPHVHRKAVLLATTKQNGFCWRGRSPRGDLPQCLGQQISRRS